ncbi:hypothetical protein E2C01_060388 [Portunus trituberculatus]|uniref:Uncharacterized protein n=1 Tax=Portunus trituberculatus TaxID=210409 RepID=A0A5B7H2C2_PORTR|nr:hypothetical protein [Portunus trituberculatus]
MAGDEWRLMLIPTGRANQIGAERTLGKTAPHFMVQSDVVFWNLTTEREARTLAGPINNSGAAQSPRSTIPEQDSSCASSQGTLHSYRVRK